MFQRAWHRIRGHRVVHHPPRQPDYVEGGINVYLQSSFQIPAEHYECLNCDTRWGFR